MRSIFRVFAMSGMGPNKPLSFCLRENYNTYYGKIQIHYMEVVIMSVMGAIIFVIVIVGLVFVLTEATYCVGMAKMHNLFESTNMDPDEIYEYFKDPSSLGLNWAERLKAKLIAYYIEAFRWMD